jgi:hypothetical protein
LGKRQKTQQELAEEWKVWEETNQEETTPAYRLGRSSLCDKPVTTSNLDSTADTNKENQNDKKGYERRNRDD